MNINYPKWNLDKEQFEKDYNKVSNTIGLSIEECQQNRTTLIKKKNEINEKIHNVEEIINRLKDENPIFEGIIFIPHRIHVKDSDRARITVCEELELININLDKILEELKKILDNLSQIDFEITRKSQSVERYTYLWKKKIRDFVNNLYVKIGYTDFIVNVFDNVYPETSDVLYNRYNDYVKCPKGINHKNILELIKDMR